MTGSIIRVLGWLVRHSHDEHHDEDGDSVRGMVVAARNEHDAMKAEIARLKAEVVNQRHEIGMLLSDLAAHKRALAAGPAALRAMIEPAWGEGRLFSVRKTIEIVEAAQAAALREGT